MASKSRNSDISNWYSGGSDYPMQTRQEAVKAPRPSQIPGLGDDGGQSSGLNRQFIRETDSDYVKLAKRGGRSDLLYDQPKLEQEAEQPGARRRLAKHTRADWFYHDDPQQNSKGAVQSRSTPLEPASNQTPGFPNTPGSKGYEQSSYDESYGSGMFSQVQGRQYDDYEDYKYGVEEVYNPDQSSAKLGPSDYYGNGSGLDYGGKYGSEYGGGDVTPATSDYGQRLNYGNGDSHLSSQMKKPPSAYDQRSITGYPGDLDRAPVQKSPFTASRESSAYSTVSQSDYSLHHAANSGVNNNNNVKSSPSVSTLESPSHHHVNRMKREYSAQSDMSKLLSFGYLDDTKSKERLDNDNGGQYVPDRQAPSRDDSRSNSAAHRSTNQVIDRSPAVQEYSGRRKPVDDGRPDFFQIGRDPQAVSAAKPPQHGRRKASLEPSQADVFGSQSPFVPGSYVPGGSSPAPVNRQKFGLTKRDEELKPDFFTIGSANQPRPAMNDYSSDDGFSDVIDKVAGLGATSAQRKDHRRQKIDLGVSVKTK